MVVDIHIHVFILSFPKSIGVQNTEDLREIKNYLFFYFSMGFSTVFAHSAHEP